MRFGQDFIEKVQEANNLVDVISQYTQLKPAAGGFMGRCPFPDHPEKTASFSVSEAKQVYNCFGCGKKGNIFTFLRDYNGMNFRDALEYLANRANIAIPEDTSADRDQQDLISKKKKELMNANKIAAQYFFESFRRLPSNHHAKVYAAKRGLTPETIQEFQIGYAGEEWDGLTNYLKSKGVSMSLAEEARLIKARKEGNGHFDLFRDRLMFPILNPMGEPIAFGGRVILQGEPKYLNSPETPVFTKGKILYGMSQAARYVRSEDQVLIVEGYMDVVSLAQSGISQCVATMGTALTPEHGKILGRMTKNVIALFDGDQAGLTAAERSLPILLASELHPKGLVLPDDMDPDDFIKARGPEALKQMLDRAPDLFTLVLGQWTQEFRGEASEKVQLCDRLLPIFESMRDHRLKGLYFREVQAKLGVEERWLMDALKFSPRGSGYQAPMQNAAPARNASFSGSSRGSEAAEKPAPMVPSEAFVEGQIRLEGAPAVEILLAGLMLKNRAYFEEAMDAQILDQVTHAGVRALLEKAAEHTRQGPEKFDKLTGLLTSIVDKPEMLIGAGEIAGGSNSDDDEGEKQERERGLFKDSLKRVRDLALKAEVARIQQQLKVAPSPELMERLMKVQRDRLNLQKES
ncbi:MAG: DNA primase [Bdellovibrionaceae bacterium]|nr:DNA primase [Pseudobdellovibrionaceae bacterium]